MIYNIISTDIVQTQIFLLPDMLNALPIFETLHLHDSLFTSLGQVGSLHMYNM